MALRKGLKTYNFNEVLDESLPGYDEKVSTKVVDRQAVEQSGPLVVSSANKQMIIIKQGLDLPYSASTLNMDMVALTVSSSYSCSSICRPMESSWMTMYEVQL